MGAQPQDLLRVLAAAREQVATALWLSAGMICAVASVLATAVGLRRTALGAGFLYSATLCFVHNGHAQTLGPVGCAAAVLGLAWPRGKERR
jgi:hypothetical protein